MYFSKLLMRAAAVSAIVAAGMGYLAYRDVVRSAALATRGIPATASIEGIRWKNIGASREDFTLDVAFSTRDGVPKHVAIPLDEERGRSISAEPEHGNVEVKYVPGDADVVQLVGTPRQTSTGRYLAMACLATLLTAVFLWRGVKRRRARRVANGLLH